MNVKGLINFSAPTYIATCTHIHTEKKQQTGGHSVKTYQCVMMIEISIRINAKTNSNFFLII